MNHSLRPSSVLCLLSSLSIVSLVPAPALAASPEQELVAAPERGRWTFSAGPAWRSRVKMETSGTVVAPTPRACETTKRDMDDPNNWDRQQIVADPRAGTGGIPRDGQLWAVTDTRTEIYGIAGQDYALNGSETDAPLGLNLQGCYDFYQGETWSVGLNLRFAGYWNMKANSSGRFNAGYTQTDKYTDLYVFEDSVCELPFTDTVDPLYSEATAAGIVGEGPFSHEIDDRGSHIVTTRLRSDLYQIGLGPKATWTPFAGICDCMDWLDVYGGVEILCNIAYGKFEADGSSTSSTDCLLGFGGNVGLVGNVTDRLGIYSQVGYEWIDKNEVSAGGFNADIDYSSCVLSAGIQFRF